MRAFTENQIARQLIVRGMKGLVNSQTITAAVTLVDDDGFFYEFDATSTNRNITLPARAASNDGSMKIICNQSSSTAVLTIVDPTGPTNLCTIAQGEVAFVFGLHSNGALGTRAWEAIRLSGDVNTGVFTTITASSTVTLSSDASVASTLTASSNLIATKTLTASSNATIASTLTASSNATVASTLAASSNLTVASTLTASSDVSVASTLTGSKNVLLGGATSNLVGFYGGTGNSQRTSSNQTSSNAAVSASFGATQLAILQEIMNTLTAASLWKGS